MNFNNYKNNHRCPKCAIEHKRNKKRYKFNDVKKFINQNGFTLIPIKYLDSNQQLTIKCNICNNNFKRTFTHFKYNTTCPYCTRTLRTKKQTYTYEYIKEQIEMEGYKLLSNEYKHSRIKLTLQCTKGHIFKIRFNNFQQGQRCIKCSHLNNRSRQEQEVVDIIKEFYKDTINISNRTIVFNKLTNRWLELDIYIPNKKIAIEYNSWYHKTNEYRMYKDELKKDICKEKGILLYVIWHDDWIKNKQNIINELKNIIQ